MSEEIAGLAAKGLGIAVNILIATIGIRATRELILDPIRENMVREQRGPTDDELDILINQMNANTEIIESAAPK